LVVCILFLPVSTEQVGLNNQKLFPFLYQGIEQPETIQPAKTLAKNKFNTQDYAENLWWNVAIDEFRKRPITGIGTGNFSNQIEGRYSENIFLIQNIFLQILVELGSPGLLLFILLLWNLIKTTNLRKPQFAIPITIFLVSQMVNSMLNDYAFTVIELYFWADASNCAPLPTPDYRLGS
jgi:O-Antigen ligase